MTKEEKRLLKWLLKTTGAGGLQNLTQEQCNLLKRWNRQNAVKRSPVGRLLSRLVRRPVSPSAQESGVSADSVSHALTR